MTPHDKPQSDLMKTHYLLYFVASAFISIGLFLWVSQGKDTNEKASGTSVKVEDIQKAVDDLRADHDGQDALLTCLFNILAEQEQITRVQIEGCVIETAVPKTNAGIAPPNQGTSSEHPQDNQASPNVSSDNSSLQELPQSPTPEEPDNGGVILDLPLLPKVNIPSPL